MNTTLLLAVRDHILAEPRRLNMSQWQQPAKPGDEVTIQYELGAISSRDVKPLRLTKRSAPPCGTVACIAGWTVRLGYPNLQLDPFVTDYYGRAVKILDISDTEANILFYPLRWPEPFRTKYPKCRGPKARAALVARVIDTFIAKPGDFVAGGKYD